MPDAPPTHRPRYVDAPSARRAYDTQRGSASARGYDRPWQHFRRQILNERPLCQDCEAADRITAATEIHHIRKLRDRPDLKCDAGNVMSLCAPCHATRTARGE